MLQKVPFLAAFVALAALLTGCVTNPIAIAGTPLQTAYAIERSYNIVLEQAIEVAVQNVQAREAIQRVETRTTPIIENLSQAITDYVTARASFAQGETTEAQVAIVGAQLETWISQAQRALLDLSTTIN